MTYDASDRKHVRKAEKQARQAERSRQDYTRVIMATPAGRQWMHSLLEQCHVFHTPFVRGASDATSYNCGQQNIGLAIFADVVTQCPTEYILMMQEASQKEAVNDRYDDNNREPTGSTGRDTDLGRDDSGPITEYTADHASDEWGPIQ